MKKRHLALLAVLALFGLAACENPYTITIGPVPNETTTTIYPSAPAATVPPAPVPPQEPGS